MILLITFCSTSNGICAASAVIKSMVFTQLIERNTLLADFKAVQNGRVYCTGADYFQQAGRLGDLIEDMNRMLSGDDAALNHIMKLE